MLIVCSPAASKKRQDIVAESYPTMQSWESLTGVLSSTLQP